jgi:hypothetical protein
MNIYSSKHSNSSSKIYIASKILYLSTYLESLVLVGLAHVIVNVPHPKKYLSRHIVLEGVEFSFNQLGIIEILI